MTKHEALKIACKTVKRFANEKYGMDSKFHDDKRAEYDKLMDVVHQLQEMDQEGSD